MKLEAEEALLAPHSIASCLHAAPHWRVGSCNDADLKRCCWILCCLWDRGSWSYWRGYSL